MLPSIDHLSYAKTGLIGGEGGANTWLWTVSLT